MASIPSRPFTRSSAWTGQHKRPGLLQGILHRPLAAPQNRLLLASCSFALSVVILSSRFNFSAAVERPIHLSILTLLLSGLLLRRYAASIASGSVSSDFSNGSSSSKLAALPITVGWEREWMLRLQAFAGAIRATLVESPVPLLVCVLIARLLLLWQVIRLDHCSVASFYTALPFLCSLHMGLGTPPAQQLGNIADHRRWTARRQHPRYALIALAWAIAARSTVDWTTPSAGSICPPGFLRWEPHIPWAQVTSVLLDFLLITRIAKVRRSRESQSSQWSRFSNVLLVSALILLVLACCSLYKPRNVRWAFLPHPAAVRHLLWDGTVASTCLLSGLYLLAHLPTRTISLIAVSAAVYTHHGLQWDMTKMLINGIPSLLASLLTLLGPSILLMLDEKGLLGNSRLPPEEAWLSKFFIRVYLIIISIFCGSYLVSRSGSSGTVTLPDLIASAWETSREREAGQSASLEEAVHEYQRRYEMPPPPNFDKWFEYAIAHHSPILDDFDQINRDLRPFWGLSPSSLREKTQHVLDYPLGMGGVQVRDGNVKALPGVPISHEWMVESIRDMIRPFAHHLPDMDLAINLDDEPRVALAHDTMLDIDREGSRARSALAAMDNLHTFEASPDSGWPALKPREDESPYFSDRIRSQLYYEYVAPSCGPNTPARTFSWWSRKDACSTCSVPHTVQTTECSARVVQNWTEAMNLCHQPDLAYLHGFLLSPAPAHPSKEAFPVFSQSKTTGFIDILIPSPWNFDGKVLYDEEDGFSWEEKENTLFWRGSPSDGFAARGSWQSFLRARLVHAAESFSWPRYWLQRGGFKGAGAPETAWPVVDIGFAGNFHKCHQEDCRSEQDTFWGLGRDKPVNEQVPFEQHWRYKHLMDVDGAGFSGRLLPFLQSGSLVYRSGLFQTWFSDRIHAWRHFIPVDVRLHELWDLLWFFGGEEKGSQLAEEIAAEGRTWSAKVLRKEDMQIYLFRLLLEWGRLVSDQRESLGYAS